jgi:hypothetical protein
MDSARQALRQNRMDNRQSEMCTYTILLPSMASLQAARHMVLSGHRRPKDPLFLGE